MRTPVPNSLCRVGLLLAVAGTIGCGAAPPTTIGPNLGQTFPDVEDWHWRYNNDDYVEVSYWHGRGLTAPAGEDWITFRVWVDGEQTIIEDIADGPSDWAVEVFFVTRPDGVYFMGWEANPNGNRTDLGSELFDGDGVPFAMSNSTNGKVWEADVNGRSWTLTANEMVEDLVFNSQSVRGAWRIDLSSDVGDVPFEGSWWLASGPGFAQWDIAAWPPADAGLWQHVHNDSYDAILGR